MYFILEVEFSLGMTKYRISPQMLKEKDQSTNNFEQTPTLLTAPTNNLTILLVLVSMFLKEAAWNSDQKGWNEAL